VKVNGRLEKTAWCSQGGRSRAPRNILLDTLDKELEQRGHKFVRYADDFVLLSKASVPVIGDGRNENLPDKQTQAHGQRNQECGSKNHAFDFLGFIFNGTHIIWSDKAYRNSDAASSVTREEAGGLMSTGEQAGPYLRVGWATSASRSLP